MFCLQGFQPLQQKHSSLSSLTQLALSLVRRLWLKLIKKSHFRDSFLLATKLPKLELYNIANNLKNLLSQDFINDLKIQIEYLNAA